MVSVLIRIESVHNFLFQLLKNWVTKLKNFQNFYFLKLFYLSDKIWFQFLLWLKHNVLSKIILKEIFTKTPLFSLFLYCFGSLRTPFHCHNVLLPLFHSFILKSSLAFHVPNSIIFTWLPFWNHEREVCSSFIFIISKTSATTFWSGSSY